MNDPRKKKNPTVGVAVFIVVVVLLVIATILYNAITEKHEYERDNSVDTTATAASAAGAAVNAAKGASQ
ncbi:hypothetical protein ACFQ3P_32355 [Paraburkholderia sabiae]|jgi:hypothetical protein|uniref:Uncharacterized protein n=1 Tax=Paraburkholderia sabiae TaxID=273251 RepID=A0ABU9QK10_9BURK|nr:hypothetical protein [Paraburkholderia sabiae]WJZ73032.1 hypothetical protein QEN71_23200 [Paraburkholderia sabiae]CAD6558890.1 hypothetical protein LMG24235_06511 [Paraburkholderia sabiae]CAG9192728.1 conserved hypothetical protein [Paraburkholderia sabiae]